MSWISRAHTNCLQRSGSSWLRAVYAELVVIGGSALLAIGLISRPTRDVDVVALLAGQTLSIPGRSLPS